ncbi:MAG: cytochrome c oxidase subunit II [Propionibacteriales bacterium]|nr:cytochrome c oxidase subunit II [Propionibacteriales bacterium]
MAPALVLGVFALAGCSAETTAQWGRLGLPEAASDRARLMGDFWINMWIAALAIGALVWALIGWTVIAYRRRAGDPEAPRQTRMNLPMEVLYTTVPFLIIGVVFYWTIRVQNEVMYNSGKSDVMIDVVGQKWSWTFNYKDNQRLGDPTAGVYDAGTMEQTPTLYLPVNKSVRFTVSSPDVIHSFWVPAFYFKRDAIPGQPTSFELTPTKEGTYAGKCAELCGTYHSLMLFKVKVVSEAEYEQHLKSLADAGFTGSAMGNSDQRDIKGTEIEQEKEGQG